MKEIYQISLEGTGPDKPARVLSYRHDDGNFIGNFPNTHKEFRVLELCDRLVSKISPFDRLEITLTKTDK